MDFYTEHETISGYIIFRKQYDIINGEKVLYSTEYVFNAAECGCLFTEDMQRAMKFGSVKEAKEAINLVKDFCEDSKYQTNEFLILSYKAETNLID